MDNLDVFNLIDSPKIHEYNCRDHSSSEQFREIRRLQGILLRLERMALQSINDLGIMTDAEISEYQDMVMRGTRWQ